MTPFTLAWKHLTRKWATTVILLTCTTLSIAVSGVLRRLYLLSESRFQNMVREYDAIVGAKSSEMDLLLNPLNLEGDFPRYIPEQIYQTLLNKQKIGFSDGSTFDSKDISEMVPILFFGHVDEYRVVGTSLNFLNSRISNGKPPGGSEVVLGASVSGNVGDKIVVAGWGPKGTSPTAYEVTVVGKLKPFRNAWDRAVFANLSFGKEVVKTQGSQTVWKENVLHFLLVKIPESQSNGLTELVNQRTVAEIISVGDTTKRLENLLSTGKILGEVLTAMIVLLSALALSGMLVTQFDAMMVPLAILKAMGFSRAALSAWLIFQGLLISVTSCFLGGLLDFAFFPIVHRLLQEYFPGNTPISIFSNVPVWVFAVLAGFMASLLPLWRLEKNDTHDSLKGL